MDLHYDGERSRMPSGSALKIQVTVDAFGYVPSTSTTSANARVGAASAPFRVSLPQLILFPSRDRRQFSGQEIDKVPWRLLLLVLVLMRPLYLANSHNTQ